MALAILVLLAATTTPYLFDETARNAAAAKQSRPIVHPPVYTLDLDLPAATRWNHIAKDYVDKMGAVTDYFKTVIPAWSLPLIEHVAAHLTEYFTEYGEELEGVAKALKVPRGEVVMLNLVMQLESIGLNCSNWNDTAPTRKDDPGCMIIDPSQKFCYCHKAHEAGAIGPDGIAEFGLPRQANAPGLCTSVVAQGSDGRIVLGRNLDWNLPVAMRDILVDIDFIKGGKKLFRATGAPGIAGVLHGMSYSEAAGGRGNSAGWSATIDARNKGGALLPNLLQALLVHSMTPSQHLRKVLETKADFESAVQALATTPQIDDNYFIVAGAGNAEGAVIARAREKAVDIWRLKPSEPNGWYRLQTNYDHWQPVPEADNRRDPGNAMMRAMGPAGVSTAAMWKVITTWPVFNHNTDVSLISVPGEGLFNTSVWMG